MESLREKVKNQKIIMALHICLNYTKKNHKDMEQIGTIWIDNNIFLINIHIFGRFIGKKPDTIKHNLNDHGFLPVSMQFKEKYKIFDKFNVNPCFIKSWVAKKHPIYCKSSTENTVNLLKFHHKKKSKKNIFTYLQSDDEYFNDIFFIDDNNEIDFSFMMETFL